jgi:hypothetical protein
MEHEADRAALERNVRLYPRYQVLLNCYFWMPVFFLYFSSHMSVGEVLRLEAIYYFTVVVLEVPSGYFSDRLGRRRTLFVAAAALAAAYALFFFGRGFAVFAAAQIMLAAGLAFNSGTDTAFHYDSLSALGREAEYGPREARINRLEMIARAVAALAGGAAATWRLGLPYGLAGLATLGMLGTVLRFREPVHAAGEEAQRGFVAQLAACLSALRKRALAWLFAFAVLMTVINHVPYELYQPYLDLLIHGRDLRLPGEGTPLVSGVVTAATMLAASWAAGRSIALRDRLGLPVTLLGTTLLQVVIMAAMGILLHEVVLILILLRSVPAAAMQAPLRAAIVPQLERNLRATYLSLQSLAGRLSFAGVLWLLSLAVPGEAADWAAISRMSLLCAGGGAVAFVVLALLARPCLRRDPRGNGR